MFEGFRFNDDGSVFMTGTGNNLNKYTSHGGWGAGVLLSEYLRRHPDPDTSVVVPLSSRAVLGSCAVPIARDPGQITQGLKWYNLDAYTSAPQTRHSMYGSGTFDITDSVTAFARGTFATSTTKTRLFPANASFGWEARL